MWRPHQEAISRCKKESLEQSAYFLAKDMSFRKDQEKMLTKEYRSLCQSPAHQFSFETKIWSPHNWIITQECQGESTIIPTEIGKSFIEKEIFKKDSFIKDIIADSNNGDDTLSYIPHHKRSSSMRGDQEKGLHSSSKYFIEESSANVTYSLTKHTTKTNESGYLGWRWLNFFHRTNAFFWNTLFLLAIGKTLSISFTNFDICRIW